MFTSTSLTAFVLVDRCKSSQHACRANAHGPVLNFCRRSDQSPIHVPQPGMNLVFGWDSPEMECTGLPFTCSALHRVLFPTQRKSSFHEIPNYMALLSETLSEIEILWQPYKNDAKLCSSFQQPSRPTEIYQPADDLFSSITPQRAV